jgi:hypothetical protein
VPQDQLEREGLRERTKRTSGASKETEASRRGLRVDRTEEIGHAGSRGPRIYLVMFLAR